MYVTLLNPLLIQTRILTITKLPQTAWGNMEYKEEEEKWNM